MGRFIDYYELLNISNNASQKEIASAYETCMATLLAQDLSPEQKDQQRMLLERAHAVLGNEFKRMAYDMDGEGGIVEGIEKMAEDKIDVQDVEQNNKTPLWLALLRRYFKFSQSVHDAFTDGFVTFRGIHIGLFLIISNGAFMYRRFGGSSGIRLPDSIHPLRGKWLISLVAVCIVILQYTGKQKTPPGILFPGRDRIRDIIFAILLLIFYILFFDLLLVYIFQK